MLYLSRSRGLNTPQPRSFELNLDKDSPTSLSTISPVSLPQPEPTPKISLFSPRRASPFAPTSARGFSKDDWPSISGDLLRIGDFRSVLDSSVETTSQDGSTSEYTEVEEEDEAGNEDEDEEEQQEDHAEQEEGGEDEVKREVRVVVNRSSDQQQEEEEEEEEKVASWPFILTPEEALASLQLVAAQRHYKQLLQARVDQQLERFHFERHQNTYHIDPVEDARVKEEELELATLLANLQFRTKNENSFLQQQHIESVERGQRTKAQNEAVKAEQAATRARSHADAAVRSQKVCLAAIERIQAKLQAEQKQAESKQQEQQAPSSSSAYPAAAGAIAVNEEKKEGAAAAASDALSVANAIIRLVKSTKISENGIDPRKINVAVNQISVQQEQVMKKVTQLKQILASAPNIESLNFGIKTLAEAICNQNITQIKAFTYAIVIFFVTIDYPLLNDMFLATLYQSCCFCIPNFLNRANYKTLDDYKRALGFVQVQADEKQVFEEEEKYLERMEGYVLLYAAYTQISDPKHRHGIAEAWKWCANVLNTKPLFATATVLGAFLKVAGFQLQQKYPRQFNKMMQFIADDFIGRLAEKNPAQLAAKRRLQLFVEHDYFKNNCQLKMPEGREMPRGQASDASRPLIEPGDEHGF